MMEGKYLITTDNWFYAPDGILYRSVWGYVEIIEDSFLGLKTNRNSTNWFAKVGTDNNHVVIAGCQIHYAVKCNDRPITSAVKDWTADAKSFHTYERPSGIYIIE